MVKSLSKNAIYNILYKCLNVLFPLVTMAYVSRTLLPIGVGKVASAQNIVSYFVIIASLGLPTYGVKKIAECSDDKILCSKVFSELFVINAISSFVCIILYFLMASLGDYFEDKMAITLVVGIQLFANIFNIDWFYQGVEEYRYIMWRSFFVKLIAFISVFAFIKNSDDYIIYALIVALSLVANYLFNIVNLHKFVTFSIRDIEIEKHLKPVFVLLATTIAIEIYTLADTTMLSIFKGDEIVGFYSNSAKAVGIVRTMIAAACAVFLPRLNYYLSHGQKDEFNNLSSKGMYMLLTLSLPAAIGLMLLADNCTYLLFGNEFEPSILSMRILTLSVVTIAISNFTGYQILVSLGKENVVLYSTIIGAIVNVFLNALLIESYGHYGAATSSIITELIIALYQMYYVARLIPLFFSKELIKQIVLPVVIMSIVVLFVKYLCGNLLIESVVACMLGTVSFIFTSYVVKNETIILIVNKLKK